MIVEQKNTSFGLMVAAGQSLGVVRCVPVFCVLSPTVNVGRGGGMHSREWDLSSAVSPSSTARPDMLSCSRGLGLRVKVEVITDRHKTCQLRPLCRR